MPRKNIRWDATTVAPPFWHVLLRSVLVSRRKKSQGFSRSTSLRVAPRPEKQKREKTDGKQALAVPTVRDRNHAIETTRTQRAATSVCCVLEAGGGEGYKLKTKQQSTTRREKETYSSINSKNKTYILDLATPRHATSEAIKISGAALLSLLTLPTTHHTSLQ